MAKSGRRKRRSPGEPSGAASLSGVDRRKALYALLVFASVWIVYAGAWNLEFTNYDDPDYVTANETVLRGLTTDGLTWAFGAGHAANWHPMTWLSHMLDVQMFGPEPGGHHLTNVLLHSVSSVLLFLVLSTATTSTGLSFFVALLFAVHPMQVETVAWISSRKGLLSSVLALGALLLYVQATRTKSRARWAGVHVLFAMSLMAKPMLVTWPFVLLLFDRWPLQRPERWPRLIAEKAGLFVLALATSVITFLVQRSGGAVADLMVVPLPERAINAVVSYARYLIMLAWPSSLAAPYPHPYLSPAWGSWSAQAVLGSAILLGALVAVTWWMMRKGGRAWWGIGMLWFFGMLVPVIGLVHVGNQAMADRYVYLPSIGLFIAVVWLLGMIVHTRHRIQAGIIGLSMVVIVGYGVATQLQMRVWASSSTLFEHTTEHTRDNWLAWNNLGTAYRAEDRQAEALVAFDHSLAIRPDYADAHFNRGNTLSNLQRLPEAEASYREALELAPERADILANLGYVLLQEDRAQEALPFIEKAATLSPHDISARINLAATLISVGDLTRAREVVETALRDFPTAARESRQALLGMRGYLENTGQ